MGISPPTQNAPTEVTESASRVAAPASAAFPPCSRILMPAAVAAGLPETITPLLPAATLGPCGQANGARKKREAANIEMILRIGFSSDAAASVHRRHVIQGISLVSRADSASV